MTLRNRENARALAVVSNPARSRKPCSPSVAVQNLGICSCEVEHYRGSGSMAIDSCNSADGKGGGSQPSESSLLLRRIADLEQKLYEKDLRDESGTLSARTPFTTPPRPYMECVFLVALAHNLYMTHSSPARTRQ